MVGFLAAAVLGGGGGASILVLGEVQDGQMTGRPGGTDAPTSTSAPRSPDLDEKRNMLLEDVRGTVRVVGADGRARVAAKGQPLARTTYLSTEGSDAHAVVVCSTTRITIAQSGRVLLRARNPLEVQLDVGQVLIRGAAQVETTLPTHGAAVEGKAYGVSLVEDAIHLSVLDGEATLVTEEAPRTFASGNVVVIRGKEVTEKALPDRLMVEVVEIYRPSPNRRYRFVGKTDPGAMLFHREKDGKRVRVELDEKGAFKVKSWNEQPEPGELVAHDAIGRRAEPNKPSATLLEL